MSEAKLSCRCRFEAERETYSLGLRVFYQLDQQEEVAAAAVAAARGSLEGREAAATAAVAAVAAGEAAAVAAVEAAADGVRSQRPAFARLSDCRRRYLQQQQQRQRTNQRA